MVQVVPDKINFFTTLTFAHFTFLDLNMNDLMSSKSLTIWILGALEIQILVTVLARRKMIFKLKNIETVRGFFYRRKKFMAVSSDLNKVFFDFPFFVPEYFALVKN